MNTIVPLEDAECEPGSAAHLKPAELRDAVEDQTAALADAKSALAESEDRFLRLMKSAKYYALYMLEASGHIASWNAGAELIEGYPAEEIIGKPLSTLYKSCDDGQARGILATAAKTGRAEEEGWRVRKDGSTFWASVTLSSIHDPAGVLLGFAKSRSRPSRSRAKYARRSTRRPRARFERRAVCALRQRLGAA